MNPGENIGILTNVAVAPVFENWDFWESLPIRIEGYIKKENTNMVLTVLNDANQEGWHWVVEQPNNNNRSPQQLWTAYGTYT